MSEASDDLHKQSMDTDILKWSNAIDDIEVELISYRDLINANKSSDSEGNCAEILQEIVEVQLANQNFKSTFEKYSNSLVGLAECDDLQCESYFLNEHTQLQNSIEKHFSSYQEFKNALIANLKPEGSSGY